MVVSEMGEQWSPHTAPAIQAEMEITIKVGLVLANTLTTIGIRMPKVPQDVPVANASPHPTRKMMAGSRFNRLFAQPLIAEATYSAAPRLSVMDFKVQAQVKIRMAGTIALKPSGTQDMDSSKVRTRRAI